MGSFVFFYGWVGAVKWAQKNGPHTQKKSKKWAIDKKCPLSKNGRSQKKNIGSCPFFPNFFLVPIFLVGLSTATKR